VSSSPAAALVAGLAFLAGVAAPWRALGQVVPPFPNTFGMVCKEELFVFRSLRHGDFDYCRLHLRYRPGTADCLRIVAPTCNVFGSDEPRRVFDSKADFLLAGQAERIVCPPGPPPPSCPAGFPSGPIPGR
jgi:hypothetical protein